ncbi:type VII secretion integral membrane protein EccD [Saccharopolyspora sp. NPDC047091]|uniref:type VII secretion integral membrane protein EccD n=1 Tax=Saccharopolyspora sp. NPDC047091 TaxID=3155924 RepID=UPI0033D184FA
MTSARAAELCRVTVFGPDGKADLAVPVSTSVADLLPVLLSHTRRRPAEDEPGSWVLQRLGEPPLDPDGTPETLDWLEGERLHLRPAADPLPQLDFDDLADGIATSVEQHPDRWRPEFGSRLFQVLSGVLLGLLAMVLLGDGPTGLHAGFAGGLALIFTGGALPLAENLKDVALARLIGLAGCGYAGIAGLIAADGVPGGVAPTPPGLLVGTGCAALAAVVLLVLHRFAGRSVPFGPFLTVLLLAVVVHGGVWLGLGFGLRPGQTAGALAAVVFGVVLFAPKVTVRAAFLRGPQLPRNAADLQQDIDPAGAEDVTSRTGHADRYLSAALVCAAAVLVAAFPLIMTETGWVTWALVSVLSCSVLLRSRALFSAWQRVSLVAAGTSGLSLVALAFAREFSPGWRALLVLGLLLVLLALVLGALRPLHRRMLPIWGHLANIFDTCTAIAVLPLLFQLLELYAWARGLAG